MDMSFPSFLVILGLQSTSFIAIVRDPLCVSRSLLCANRSLLCANRSLLCVSSLLPCCLPAGTKKINHFRLCLFHCFHPIYPDSSSCHTREGGRGGGRERERKRESDQGGERESARACKRNRMSRKSEYPECPNFLWSSLPTCLWQRPKIIEYVCIQIKDKYMRH